MSNACSAPNSLVWNLDPVMSSKPGQRELEHHLACPLWPAVTLLRIFQAPKLATNVEENAGKLWTHGVDRPLDPLLRGNDLIAQFGTV